MRILFVTSALFFIISNIFACSSLFSRCCPCLKKKRRTVVPVPSPKPTIYEIPNITTPQLTPPASDLSLASLCIGLTPPPPSPTSTNLPSLPISTDRNSGGITTLYEQKMYEDFYKKIQQEVNEATVYPGNIPKKIMYNSISLPQNLVHASCCFTLTYQELPEPQKKLVEKLYSSNSPSSPQDLVILW